MRDLFYTIVEWITRQITGLDNHCMSLWDLPVWLKVEHDVTLWCIIVCMLVVTLIVVCILNGMVNIYYTHQEKNGIKEE